MKTRPKLEDMCNCNKTLPLRNKLREINSLYEFYSKLKESPISSKGYADSFKKVVINILETCESYEIIVMNQLRHNVMLAEYRGKTCCAGCKTEIAFPDKGIETELYFELVPEHLPIVSLN